MSTTTLTPNSVVSNTGALTGAADIPTAWTDASNASYVTYDSLELSVVGLTDPSPAIPANSTVYSIALQVKCARVTSTTSLSSQLATGGDSQTNVTTISNTSPTWITVNTWYPNYVLVDADMDALTASVGCVNPTYDLRVYEARVVITVLDPPTLTVDAPVSPPDITDHNQVTVEWTVTLSLGSFYTYEAKIFDSATYGAGGFDPDTSTPTATATGTGGGSGTSFGSHAFTDALSNGDYRAYVQVVDNSRPLNPSDWEYSAFTIDVLKPAVPTLTLTPDNELARIAVELTANAGDATTDWFEVERSEDGGVTWNFVRTAEEDGTIANDGGTGGTQDFEAPNGTTCTYRARAVHDYGNGLTAASAWVQDTSAWSSSVWWIKHPTLPNLNRAVTIRSHASSSRPANQGIFRALGSSNAIVVSDARGPWSGDLVILTETFAEQEGINDLLDAGVPLLLQGPPNHYVSDRWVVFGEHTRTRLIDKGWSEPVDESLPWTEVQRPSNAQLPGLFPAIDLLIP